MSNFNYSINAESAVKEYDNQGGKSSVSCPLKPSDSAPLR